MGRTPSVSLFGARWSWDIESGLYRVLYEDVWLKSILFYFFNLATVEQLGLPDSGVKFSIENHRSIIYGLCRIISSSDYRTVRILDLRTPNSNLCIWVRSRNCGCLVTWFCYQMITKPSNKTAAVPWPDPSQDFVITLSWGFLHSRSRCQMNTFTNNVLDHTLSILDSKMH